MSDDGSDNGFGDASWVVEKDTFTVVDRVEIEHSPSGRGDKRRRLNPSPRAGLSNSHRSTDDSEDDFDPPGHPARSVEQTLASADDQVNDDGNDHAWSRRPRQRAHVPKQMGSPETTYQLGTQAPASSPYRIRGPRWKIPKSATTRIISTTPVADASCRPTTPQRRRSSLDSSSDDDAFDPSPYTVGTGSALGCQGRSTVTPTKRPSTFAKLGDAPSNTPSRASLSSPAQFVSGTPPNQPGLRTDIVGELENLPSDAFDSEPPSDTPHDELSHSQAVGEAQTGRHPVGPKSGLRQTTLFSRQGIQPAASASLVERPSNFPGPAKKEPPTHHKLNRDALKKWIYPTNLGTIRDYQFNIVQRGLFHNLLVALPTGLGKTFIAATIMLNWLRWTQDAQIVFVAPTKPLVAQQIEACYGIVGMPRSQTTMLTGGVSPGIRDEEWANKRVFFMTPQTFINDLKHGRADPKRIVCVVVDEAHRATGGYAYVEVVRFIRRFNQSFRVLALTATPGASIEAVQEVIDGLDISRVEIRTEESLDIRTYVHRRNVEVVTFDPSEDMIKMKELYSKALQPVLNKLNEANAYWVKDPLSLTAFGLTKARMGWMGTAGKTASPGLRGMMMAIFSVLASRAHSITLLNYHGIGPFYHNLLEFRKELEGGRKGSKYSKQIAESPHFRELMDQGQRWINDAEFVGHPKLAYLREIVMNHFLDAGEGQGPVGEAPPPATRIMIFCHYRDSAEEVVRVLKRNMPTIRPSAFVGQAGAKGSEGMSQKVQTEVISNFQKGVFNTLVATSVGEEGLDIGEVDLIICYDSSASPIRMLQRMGRTGRKRAGNIKLLLMRGKEEDSFAKAKDIYEGMQQQIATGTKFTFHDERSPRILPKDIQPEVDKRIIDIPVENTQAELPEPTRRGKKPKKAAPKKFHMPDGVNTGFVKASRVRGEGDETAALTPEDEQAVFLRHQLAADELAPVPSLEDVLLTKAQEKELERRFRDVADGGCSGRGDGDDANMVSVARLDAFPARQRTLGRTRRIGHGQSCERAVRLFNTMHNVNDGTIRRLNAHILANERETGDNDDPRVVETRRRTNPRATEVLSLSSDADETSEDADAEELRPAQRRPISPEELDGVVEGGENDRDSERFSNDESEENTDSSPLSISTPPSLIDHDTRFYISPKKPAGGRANSDSSLPDFSTLVSTFRPDETDLEEVMEEAISDDDQEVVTMTQRRRGRQVLQDSDDSL